MEKEQNSDSDSSFELPDLNPKRTFDIEKLEKGNLVWAAYKGLHWPALIRSIDKKNKNVRIWYLDTPGKCFKVPFNKIENFEDLEINKKVLNEAKLSPLGQKHYDVFRRSLLFLFRRSDGIQDNPAEFFDTSKPYFLRRAFDHEKTKLNITSENTSTERVDDNSEGSSVGESLTECDEESHPITKSFPEICIENSPYNDEMVDKIVSCIKAGHVDKHLMKIVNSQIVNERHDLFIKAVKMCNTELLSSSPSYIPIVNTEKLQDISLYLSDLYEKKVGTDKLRMSEYVVSVWLPEAVDKALSLIETDTLEQPISVGTVSNLSLEAVVEENINKSSTDKVSFSKVDSSKLTINWDSKIYKQQTREVIVKNKGKSEKQPIDCESKTSTVSFKNSSLENNIEAFTLFTSDLKDSDSTVEAISVRRSPRKHSSNEMNKEISNRKKQKDQFKTSISPKKPVLHKITKLKEENCIIRAEDSDLTVEAISVHSLPRKKSKKITSRKKRKGRFKTSISPKKPVLQKITKLEEENCISSAESSESE